MGSKHLLLMDICSYTDPICVLNVTRCCGHCGDKMLYLLHLHFSLILVCTVLTKVMNRRDFNTTINKGVSLRVDIVVRKCFFTLINAPAAFCIY